MKSAVSRQPRKLSEVRACFHLGISFHLGAEGQENMLGIQIHEHDGDIRNSFFVSAEDFDGCQPTVKLWGVVIQPYCIIQHKEPQLDVVLLRPMDRKVEHHGSSHVVYCSNCSFGSRILMVGADS